MSFTVVLDVTVDVARDFPLTGALTGKVFVRLRYILPACISFSFSFAFFFYFCIHRVPLRIIIDLLTAICNVSDFKIQMLQSNRAFNSTQGWMECIVNL